MNTWTRPSVDGLSTRRGGSNSGMIVAIIQARMSSSRLPGKVLADIAGRPMLWHVVDRAKRSRYINKVVVGTSIESADDPIDEFCRSENIECFRGSHDDVLDRFYRAASRHEADAIVRITADCPLIDPTIVDRVIETYLTGKFDYVSNALRYTYPDGLDAEVFSMAALETAWRDATEPRQREHVVPFIKNHPAFRKTNVENETDLSREQLRWAVDEPRDLEFMRVVYSRLFRNGQNSFGLKEVLELLSKEPELQAINQG
ncbi:MAG: glycosyltransferase family protein, partial [Verrucomicrobia bacterium]|nr:glycosyltransferase family protein [Verrucomicrobiota bacterium]